MMVLKFLKWKGGFAPFFIYHGPDSIKGFLVTLQRDTIALLKAVKLKLVPLEIKKREIIKENINKQKWMFDDKKQSF